MPYQAEDDGGDESLLAPLHGVDATASNVAEKRARECIVSAPSGFAVSETYVTPPATAGSSKIMIKRPDGDGGWVMATMWGRATGEGAEDGGYKITYDTEDRTYHVVTLKEANYSAAVDAADFCWASLAKQGRRRC